MTTKRDELLEGVAQQTANYAREIIIADTPIKRRTATIAYLNFLHSIIASVLMADNYDTGKEKL